MSLQSSGAYADGRLRAPRLPVGAEESEGV